MSAIASISILILSGAIGLGIGFWARTRPPEASHELARTNDAQTFVEAGASNLHFSKHTDAIGSGVSPLAGKLALDLSMSKGVTNWLYWMEAIEQAGTNDLPHLAR